MHHTSSIASMPSYSMSGSNLQNSCLQQQASQYSCMLPPGRAANPYDPLSLGSYGHHHHRTTGCGPTAHQAVPHHQSLNASQFAAAAAANSAAAAAAAASTGLISPGVSVPVQVPGSASDHLTAAGQHYWPRVQCN